jgi:CHAT domain-containing protein
LSVFSLILHDKFGRAALIQLQQTLSKKELFELEDAIAVRQTKWKAMAAEDKPFNNPFYWAAFIASGV